MASPAANASVYQPISGWYTDRSLLVTGATGFMGKVLVEKLLRSCRGVRCIYLLIRPKRGQGVADRLQALLDAPLFDKLRTERPSALGKIVPIQGDVTEPDLGISPSDRALLVRNVSVVFHSAATVKFDEALRLSVTINMLGTKRLVELCHQMLSLEALVHVSTAYCNCDREEVREIIYPPPYDPEHIMQCMQWMDEDLIQSLTPKLIGKRPNTYTFTKALAESMLLKECGNLPVAIVRPSIVLSSWKEPMAGWVDNWNGPTGIIAAAGKGFFRTMLCHESKTADLVPVDLVINLMIAAAWKTATKRPDGIAVYNCCTGQQNAITWKMFVDNCFRYLRMHPLSETMWYPDGRCRSNPIVNKLFDWTLHVVPAHVIDMVARVLQRKPIMVRVQTKLSKAAQCLEYFSTQQWRFVDENVQALNASLSVEDRATFCFDVRTIDWPRYLEGYVLGIRHFIFKEHPSTLPGARKQLQRLYWMHRLAQLSSILFVWRILMSHSKLARQMWLVTLELIVRIARLIPYV